MRIGYLDYTLGLSIRIYVDRIVQEIRNLGISMVPFGFGDPLPEDVDVYWDPRQTATTLPTERFNKAKKPCVATIHDGTPFLLWPWEFFPDLRTVFRRYRKSSLDVIRWRRSKIQLAAIITVSHNQKVAIERILGLRGQNIIPIYLGVDHELFMPLSTGGEEKPFFLHVSHYVPRKNVDRVKSAYRKLPSQNKPELVAVLPGYKNAKLYEGIRVIPNRLSHRELVTLYQKSMGFVFPSLYEGFGIPIIEAMACGCPVITSNVSACPEVAGDAALLVNPRSVNDIANAMQRLIDEPDLRQSLRLKGIDRAKMFSWRKCAEEHLRVFEQVLA